MEQVEGGEKTFGHELVAGVVAWGKTERTWIGKLVLVKSKKKINTPLFLLRGGDAPKQEFGRIFARSAQ